MKQLNSHNFSGIYKDFNINIDKLGCVMLDLIPAYNMAEPEMDGLKDILYTSSNEDRKWIDGWVVGKTPHITLLYGLLENAHKIEEYIKAVLNGWKIEAVEIDKVGYFESTLRDEPYYCIVAHIKVTDELMEGHQRLELLPHINTFTGYMPHMTICYIKKESQKRDSIISAMNDLWSGKKLRVKSQINLGYAERP